MGTPTPLVENKSTIRIESLGLAAALYALGCPPAHPRILKRHLRHAGKNDRVCFHFEDLEETRKIIARWRDEDLQKKEPTSNLAAMRAAITNYLSLRDIALKDVLVADVIIEGATMAMRPIEDKGQFGEWEIVP